MKIRHFLRSVSAVCLAAAVVSLTGCGFRPYLQTDNRYAGRPTPPSQLLQRVVVTVGNTGLAGSGGSMPILDARRDLRNSVYNLNTTFSIGGYSANNGTRIISYPEQMTGYVYSYTTAGASSLTAVDYSTEKTAGTTASFTTTLSDVAISSDGLYTLGAQESAGLLDVVDRTSGTAGSYPLPLPGVYKVGMNTSHTIMLAMVRNSNQLYRVVKLNSNMQPPANYVSCQPQTLPVYCILPVSGTFDRPYQAYFPPDGTTVDILNCGPECGGTTASVSVLNLTPMQITNYDSTGVAQTTNIPLTYNGLLGGATVGLSDGSTLYVAGQTLMPDGLFTGTLTTIDPSTNKVTGLYSLQDGYDISDGTHTKLLFADNNTLWIGSQLCASGERQKNKVNYNCLTRFDRTANTSSIVPNVNPAAGTPTVPNPNDNQDPYYYGSLTGLCWVQGYGKVYTAYGGQVHFFYTADGSEGDNFYVTVQGVALDVAYPDAATNLAN